MGMVKRLVAAAGCVVVLVSCASDGSLASSQAALEPEESPASNDLSGSDSRSATGGEQTETATPTPEPQPTPTPEPTATPAPTPAPVFAFTSAAVDGINIDEPWMALHDALAPSAERPQWVLVGSISEPGRSTPTVWMSDTASVASASPIALEESDRGDATNVAVVDGVVIAVGVVWPEADPVPVVWRYDDDRWQQVDTSGISGEIDYFHQLFGVGGSLIATGSGPTESGDSRLSVLVSTDQGTSWSPAEFDDFGHPSVIGMNGVAMFDDRLIAVGDHLDATGRSGAGVVWESEDDGRSWRGVQEVTSSKQVRFSSIVKHGDRLMVAGSVRDDIRHEPTIWTSTDGESWRQEETTFAASGWVTRSSGRAVTDLRSSGDRLLARSWNGFHADVWTSADGLSWDTLDDLYAVDRAQRLSLVDIDFNLDGTIVGVDSRQEPVEYRGGTWQRVGDSSSFPQPEETVSLAEVAWKDGRFVAVGSERDWSTSLSLPLAWWSADGETWTNASVRPRASTAMSQLTATAEGFVATGPARFLDTDDDFNLPHRFWFSPNGESWTAAATSDRPSEGGMRSVMDLAVAGDGLFMVGIRYEGADEILRPMVGFGDGDGSGVTSTLATDVPFEQYAFTACGGPDESVAFMGRTDGGVEIRAIRYAADTRSGRPADGVDGSFTSSEGQRVDDCVWTGSEFVAAGVRADGADVNGAIWTSPDGVSWTAAETPPSMSAEGEQWLNRVVSFAADGDHGAGLIVVADDSSRHNGSVLWVLHDDEWWVVDNLLGDETTTDIRIDDLAIGDGQIVAVGVNRGVNDVWAASLDSLLASLSAPG